MINIIEVTGNLRNKYNDELIDFTKNFIYPFGLDSFSIDHGKNYFSFFDGIGYPLTLVALAENRIIAAITVIKRNIDIYKMGHLDEVWYICDLKIAKKFHGQFILQKFIKFAAEKYPGKFKLVYGISMDSKEISKNKIINLAKNLPNPGFNKQETLLFYLLDICEVNSLKHALNKYYQNYSLNLYRVLKT